MPSIFIDDGAPEAAESTSSYVTYDEDDLESMLAALDDIRHRALAPGRSAAAAEQFLLDTIASKKAEWRRQQEQRRRGPLRRFVDLFRRSSSGGSLQSAGRGLAMPARRSSRGFRTVSPTSDPKGDARGAQPQHHDVRPMAPR